MGADRTATPLALALAMFIVSAITGLASPSAEGGKAPLAIGFGDGERFVLYSDGELHRLTRDQPIPIAKLDLNASELEAAIVDFEVYGQHLYLYAYEATAPNSGRTTVAVYDLATGGEVFKRAYAFAVARRDGAQEVSGQMVLAASACPRGLAVMAVNGTRSSIEVFVWGPRGLQRAFVYDGRMAMGIYRNGSTLIAATFRVERMRELALVVPQVTDLIENRTLFSLPALTPVAALAYPFVQVFNRNGSWECHVSVYNQMMNRMEYYVVYPERQGLVDSNATRVSPYMDYLIVDQREGSKVVFRDGEGVAVGWRLSIIPQGAHVPLDPQNGVLDADLQGKALLAKVVEGDEAKILYITREGAREVYALPARRASKAEGLYAALVQGVAYIVDPEVRQLVAMEVVGLGQGQGGQQFPTTLILAIAATACVATSIAMIKRRKRVAL